MQSSWFHHTSLDGYIRIREPGYADNCNIWLLRRDPPHRTCAVLIDCGTGAQDLYAFLLSSGLMDAETALVVIVTHQHSDHAGGLRHFQGRPNVVVCCGRGDVDALTKGHDEVKWAIQPRMWTKLPYPGWDAPSFLPLVPVAIDRILDDGDVIPEAGLQVISLPGHTPGSIALLDKEANALFNGDTAYSQDTIVSFPSSSPAEACKSMNKLLSLEEGVYSKAYPGHWGCMTRDEVNGQCQLFLSYWEEEKRECKRLIQ